MRLQQFTTDNAAELRSWFRHDQAGNEFIAYYAEPDRWLQLVDSVQRFALAAVEHDHLVGFADVELQTDGMASLMFGIAPQQRGQGLGGKLPGLIAAFAAEHGAHTLIAKVEHANDICILLLIAAGFEATGDDGQLTTYTKDIG